ncbi:thioredoxin-like protein [Dactylonectria estremocensis]|uniref:Thioredoxin-like protein n=1 Tax=Dactylonectria estremocensis TaxID=1079267 RepID=A0A9P9ETH5_9HYPO|nr:thioredoxin-like protein [Dactylonectria estremocensis]
MTSRLTQLQNHFSTIAAKTKTDITLYTVDTPNGIKVSILLEVLGLDYKVHPIKMMDNEQKEPWFLENNPNGRIPAITDTFTDGAQLRVFESGAILEYLVDRYDQDHKVSYPRNTREHWETTSWVRYAPEKIEYGINRYVNETRRLYRTMDTHLAKSTSGFLVCDRVTIADVPAGAGRLLPVQWADIDLAEFPHLEKWLYKLLERPGFRQGRNVPSPHTALDNLKLTEEEIKAKAAASKA